MLRTTRNRLIRAITAVVLAASAVTMVGPSTEASAATGTPLVGAQSNRCLDVAGNSTAAGTAVQLWDCYGSDNQSWNLSSAGELRTFNDTMCLDASGGGTSAGTLLVIWTCSGTANQKFTVNSDGSVRAQQSGLCLDAEGQGTANGTRVLLWTCNGTSNQQWSRTSTTPPPSGDRGLHVDGRYLVDGNGERVVFRAIEHILRWGDYGGSASIGDVPWEGGSNDYTGAQLDDIASTGANAVRLFGGLPNELDPVLHKAIVDKHMWVSIGRVNWSNATVVNTLKKYSKYISLHVRGEFQSSDENAWKNAAINDIKQIRALGLTSPIEVQPTGYGQHLQAIINQGSTIFSADPLKNVIFSYQLYSELAKDVNGALNATANYPTVMWAGSCLFQGGINNGYGNDYNTFKQVWDGTASRQLGSLYWAWSGDGEGNNLTSNGRLNNLTWVGQYIIYDSPYALRKYAPKSSYILNAKV